MHYNSLGSTAYETSLYTLDTDTVSSLNSKAETHPGTTGTTDTRSSIEGDAEVLSAYVSLTPPDDVENYHRVLFTSGNASSVLDRVNDLYHYEPSRAFDGDQITSWQEGNKKSDGQGEWLELYFKERKSVKYITICLGNWRDSERYKSNNRPKEMQIRLGEMTFTVQFTDVMKPQYITFSEPVEADYIRFIITDVVVGTNGAHDCCISEVYAYSTK